MMAFSMCNCKVFEEMIDKRWVICLACNSQKLIIIVINMLNICLISTVKVIVLGMYSVEHAQWHTGVVSVSYTFSGLTVKTSRVGCSNATVLGISHEGRIYITEVARATIQSFLSPESQVIMPELNFKGWNIEGAA